MHMRSHPARVAALSLLALVLLAPACSDDDSSSDSADRTTTTEGSGNLSVSTPEGEVSLSLDGDLPPDWPSDFPLPDKTEPAGSGSLAGESSGVMIGVFSTTESGTDAFDFYTGETSLDPSDETSAGVGSGFAGSMKIAGDYDGSVTVAGIESTTYVVVILNNGGVGSTSSTTTADASITTAAS